MITDIRLGLGVKSHQKQVRYIMDAMQRINRHVSHTDRAFLFGGKQCANASMMVYDTLVRSNRADGWSLWLYRPNIDNWRMSPYRGDFHVALFHKSGLYVDCSNNDGGGVMIIREQPIVGGDPKPMGVEFITELLSSKQLCELLDDTLHFEQAMNYLMEESQ